MRVLAFATSAAIAGCAVAPPGVPAAPRGSGPASATAGSSGGAGAAVPAGGAGALPARPLRAPANALSPYLRIQPQQTGLVNATDDGRNTFLAFVRAVPDEIAVFDQDGRPVVFARAGAIVAVAGVHRGLLVRIGAGNSFIAPNPRAVASERPSLDDDPDVQDAQSRLEGEASQLGAFMHALQRADAGANAAGGAGPNAAGGAGPGGGAAPGGVGGGVPAVGISMAGVPVAGLPLAGMPASGIAAAGAAGRPIAAESAGALASGLPTPGAAGAKAVFGGGPALIPAVAAASDAAAAGDDATWQRLPGGGALVRVFFASGSRAIVRPDDGLARLENEARGADEIRIVGYTDSTGSLTTNTALSQSRAFAIRSLLVQRGVAAERITVAGLPASNYLGDNATERGRALNRRVEVQLLRRMR